MMYKIIRELGSMLGHTGVSIYELEELGLVAIDGDRSDGTNMEAWKCDEFGYAIDPEEKSMSFHTVSEVTQYSEFGEPEEFNTIGFGEGNDPYLIQSEIRILEQKCTESMKELGYDRISLDEFDEFSLDCYVAAFKNNETEKIEGFDDWKSVEQFLEEQTNELGRAVEMEDKIADRKGEIMDMDALGYEPAQVDGFSDDFLMWKEKGNENETFGLDGWEAVKDYANDIKALMNNYTLQELQNRANGDYSIIEYGTYGDQEVQAAIKNYPQQETVITKNDKLCKGFAYENGKKKPTVLYGSSKEEILERLNIWNRARSGHNQLVTCNIGYLQENEKYDNFCKFDVKTGKEIANTYLKIPPMPKDKFSEITKQLKKDGAKYNPFKKEWYVEKGVDLAPFRKYIPDTEKNNQETKVLEENGNAEITEESKEILNVNEIVKEYNELVYGETLIEKPKVEIPDYSIDLQYKVSFNQNGMNPLYISTSDIGDIQNMTLGQIIEKLEEQVSNILVADKDYQIGISTTQNECSIYFRDGRDTITLSGDELGVDFRSLQNNQVEAIINDYMNSPESVLDQVKNEVREFSVGENIDVFVSNRNDEGIQHVQGTIKEVLRSHEVVETLTYVVENENGIQNIPSQNVYSEAQREVLIKAIDQGLSMEQMELMCDMRFSAAQMDQIRCGYADGLSIEQVALYSNPLISPGQMDICRISQIHGIPFEKIPYAPDSSFNWLNARNQLNENIVEHRKELAKVFTKEGFQPNEKLIKKLEELNHLTKKNNKILDVCEAYKNKTFERGSKKYDLVKEIGDELRQQEMLKIGER